MNEAHLEIKGHISKDRIVVGPDHTGYTYTLVLSFARERNGWVRVSARKSTWSYSTTERRWSYDRAPSADASIVASIVAACESTGGRR